MQRRRVGNDEGARRAAVAVLLVAAASCGGSTIRGGSGGSRPDATSGADIEAGAGSGAVSDATSDANPNDAGASMPASRPPADEPPPLPGGACPATPMQLVDFNSLASQFGATGLSATQLAADAANLYFVFGGALVGVPVQGGPIVTLSTLTSPNAAQANDPVATSTAVVFHRLVGNDSNEAIVGVPKAGGSPMTLATTHGRVLAFTADDSGAYFVDSTGLQSVPAAGGSVHLLSAAIPATASGIAVIGPNVVVTTRDPTGSSGAVYAVPIGGGAATALAMQQPNAAFPMACGTDTCWWTGASYSPEFGASGPGFIARLAGGQDATVSAPVYPWSLSFDGTDFYETVGCDLCSGMLVRIPSSGAPAVTMATAGFAVVEGACVYFSVTLGFDLPAAFEGGIPGSGIYAVSKAYADPMFQRDP